MAQSIQPCSEQLPSPKIMVNGRWKGEGIIKRLETSPWDKKCTCPISCASQNKKSERLQNYTAIRSNHDCTSFRGMSKRHRFSRVTLATAANENMCPLQMAGSGWGTVYISVSCTYTSNCLQSVWMMPQKAQCIEISYGALYKVHKTSALLSFIKKKMHKHV